MSETTKAEASAKTADADADTTPDELARDVAAISVASGSAEPAPSDAGEILLSRLVLCSSLSVVCVDKMVFVS